MKELVRWKNKRNRKPLILKGARQVGKTWLMKEFGNRYFDRIAYVNFDSDSRMRNIFDQDYDISRIIRMINIETGVRIEPEKTLIIFDEVQEAPKAISSLKYFCENAPEYAVIAAGSRTPLGSYDPVAMPPDGRMPYITQPMWEWLELHGYLGQLPDNYRGPDRSSHKPLVERTGNGAQPSRHMPKDCRFGMIRASATPYPDHGRHDGVRDQAWGLARLCAERGASQAEFDRLMDQVRANAGDHDPKDTERLIKGAAERNGYAYHAR